jgi:hypothetical protein
MRLGAAQSKGVTMRFFNGRNPFASMFGSSRREEFVVRYVLREHSRGRSLAEILDDPYVRNRSTAEERARLVERPELVAALGESALAGLRNGVASPLSEASRAGTLAADSNGRSTRDAIHGDRAGRHAG